MNVSVNLHFLVLMLLASIVSCSAPSSDFGMDLDSERPSARFRSGVYDAADPESSVVTLETLYQNERFWPYQIQLTSDWKPEGWDGEFGWGLGVLLGIDDQNRLRVDFARFGKHWVPADQTDVVARANEIRLGGDVKFGPNLVIALKNRLLDPSGRELREIEADPFDQSAFALVIADPTAPDFEATAREIETIESIPGVMSVLLAQGGYSDVEIYRACFHAGWPGAFLLDRFNPAYTQGYLGREPKGVSVLLFSPEGRLLAASHESDESVTEFSRRVVESLP